MPALPIREHLKVLDDLPFRVVVGSVVPRGHAFTLERPKDALHPGVTPAVHAPRHAGGDAVSGQQQLVPRGGILTAAIRVMQEPGQLYGQPVPHRPADHAAQVQIEDDGEVEPALCGPHVRAVPGPHPVWMRHRELASEGVLGHGPPVIRLGAGSPRRHGLGSDPVDPHQPNDTIRAAALPLQGSRDSWWITRLAESRVGVFTDGVLSGRDRHAS